MKVTTRLIVATLVSISLALWIMVTIALGQMWATNYWGSKAAP